MQLEQRIVDNVAIIKVTGDITLSKGGDVLLKDKVQSLLHQGYTNLLIDLSGVSYVDSAGLGELVQTYVTAKNRGGRLRLLNPTKRLKDLLVVTKLLTVFESYDNEAAAIASFQAASARATLRQKPDTTHDAEACAQ
jgi:anti-sigma B factor antagonist